VEQGESLSLLEAAALSKGRLGDRARAELSARPTLTQYEAYFWQAFHDLTTTRAGGMGVKPIPYDRIVDYASFHGFGYTDTLILIRVIRAMDNAFLDAVRKKQQPSE
jgi:hypothetical protein